MNDIHVANLCEKVTKAQLLEAFQAYGQVHGVDIVRDSEGLADVLESGLEMVSIAVTIPED